MMKKLMLIMMALLAWTSSHAQPPFSQVDQWLDAHAAEMGGRLMLVVQKDGKIIYCHAVNKMSSRQQALVRLLAKRKGVEPALDGYSGASKQPIASCSKWLSAALVMIFVDEGQIQLTDTVGKFLPVLSKNGKGGITIGQCLSHMTGILSPDLKDDLHDIRQANNMDEVIEKVSGKSFQALFEERLAAPLEMRHTDFGNRKVALPAGGASSTPDDYINFLTMILNKGTFHGKRILSEKSVDQMQLNRITADVKVAYTPTQADGIGYGYGAWIMGPGTVSSPGLFGSYPWVDNKAWNSCLIKFYTPQLFRLIQFCSTTFGLDPKNTTHSTTF